MSTSESLPIDRTFLRLQKKTPSFGAGIDTLNENNSPTKNNYSNNSEEELDRILNNSPPFGNPTINDRSKNIKRNKAIYDHLLETGKKYEENKEHLRYSQMNDFLEKAQPHSGDEEGDVIDIQTRFKELENERIEKIQKLRDEKLKEDMSYPFKPSISQKSAKLTGRSDIVSLNKSWVEEREQWLNTQREKALSAIPEESFIPRLNPRTLKIINRIKARKRKDVQSYSQQQYLEQREFERKQKIFEKTGLKEDEEYGNPRITPQAAMLIREGSACDRLYEESFRLNQKESKENFDFKPKILCKSSPSQLKCRESGNVYEDLFRKSEEKRARLAKLEQEKQKEVFSPCINELSQEIASRLPTSTYERLLNTSRESPKRSEYSFKPSLNSKSIEIDMEKKVGASPSDRIDHLLSKNEKTKERIKILRKEAKEREMKDCTFSPTTNVTCGGYTEHQYKSFNERIEQWEKRRRAKVSREKRAKEKDDLKGCTFSPEIKKSLSKDLKAEFFHDSSVTDPVGFEEFIHRHNEARERRERKKQGIFITGENWRYRKTVPKEFTFNKKVEKIRSLERPVSPNKKSAVDSSNTPQEPKEDLKGLTLSDFGIDMCEPMLLSDDDEVNESLENDIENRINNLSINGAFQVPPQGLFSSRSTVSILESLRYGTSKEEISSTSFEERSQTRTEPLSSTDEWLKRSKEKETKRNWVY